MAVGLSLMLTGSTLAGEIHIGKAPPPPPPSDSTTASTPGIIEMPGTIDTPEAPRDSAMIEALNMVQNLLSIF